MNSPLNCPKDFAGIGLVEHNIKGLGLTSALSDVARLGEEIQSVADLGATQRVDATVTELKELLTVQ